jgi:serine/threonine protein kinase
MDELLVMSKLDHPNIVSFLGACMTPPNLCFVMELCDQSLFDMLHAQRAKFTASVHLSRPAPAHAFPLICE